MNGSTHRCRVKVTLTMLGLLLMTVAGLPASAAYATGAWTPQATGVTFLYTVCFTDASHGWAVGNDGTILATTDGGAHWVAQTSGTTQYLMSVSFTDSSNGWAVGGGGDVSPILGTTDGGAHWVAQTSETTAQLNSVCFTDASHGWAVGDEGTILATTDGGAHWVAQTSGTSPSLVTGLRPELKSVSFTDSSHGWAVGGDYDSGDVSPILATTDGGAHWVAQTSGTTEGLASVFFTDSSHGWAVGGGIILAFDPTAVPVTLSTTTKLVAPSSVKLKKPLKLTGTVSPAAAIGTVTITKTRLVGRTWRPAGSAKVTVRGGKYSYSFKPTLKGKWRFVAKYSGGVVGATTYKASKSATKSVTVK